MRSRHVLAVAALFCLCFLLCDCSARAVPMIGRQCDFGCLFFRGDDVEGNRLKIAAGPFFEERSSTNGAAFLAVRPFYSVLDSRQDDRRLHEILWPVGMVKGFRGETDWRFLTALGHDFDNTKPDSRYRLAVLPILFAGRDARGQTYFALFPLGGRINEFLGRDSVVFLLFPLYARSRVKDLESHNLLWPFISWCRGEDVDRFRVFPFYGRSHNHGRWVKRYIMWPFWSDVRYVYPDATGRGFVLFPLYGHAKVGKDTQTWMVLPPLFRFSRSAGHVERNCPWPFVQYASGHHEKLYLWPVWGRKSRGTVDSWFCLWPIVSGKNVDRGTHLVKRLLVLPFVHHETRTAVGSADGGRDAETDAVMSRYLKLWPLFRYERRASNCQFHMLALWPFKRAFSIERNYSPFWTLYSRSSVAERQEDRILWGLFRRRRDNRGNSELTVFPVFRGRKTGGVRDSREWSVLFGLAGYKREELRKTWRLLYLIKWQTGKDGEAGNSHAGTKASPVSPGAAHVEP